MMATGYLTLDWALVSEMMTDAYQGLQKRYETKGEIKDGCNQNRFIDKEI